MAEALREVFARFGFDFDEAKLERANKGVDRLAQRAESGESRLAQAAEGIVTAFAGSRLLGGIKDFASELDVLDDLNAQTGVATDQLQLLAHAAELNGASAREMFSSLELLQKSLGRTDTATSAQSDAMRALGIAISDASGQPKKLADVLPEVFQNFGQLTSEAQQAQVATALFGRAGVRMIPTLRQGAKGLDELRASMAEYGGVVSEETIASAGEFRDNIARLDLAFFNLKGSLASAVFPQLSKIITAVGKGVGRVADWIKNTTLAQTATTALAATLGGKLFNALKPFIGPGLKFSAIFLAVDDVLAFLQGQDSVIGDLLNRVFGAGTATVVRDWVNSAIGEFSKFRDSAAETFSAIEDHNKSFGVRWIAAFVGFIRDLASGFPFLRAMVSSELLSIVLAFNEAELRIVQGWNDMVSHLPDVISKRLKIDTTVEEARVEDQKARKYAIDQRALAIAEGRPEPVTKAQSAPMQGLGARLLPHVSPPREGQLVEAPVAESPAATAPAMQIPASMPAPVAAYALPPAPPAPTPEPALPPTLPRRAPVPELPSIPAPPKAPELPQMQVPAALRGQAGMQVPAGMSYVPPAETLPPAPVIMPPPAVQQAVSLTQNNPINITVNAPVGQSPRATARELATVVRQETSTNSRAALQALTQRAGT